MVGVSLIVTAGVMLLVVSIAGIVTTRIDNKKFNRGTCTRCGGSWRVRKECYEGTIWECDNCSSQIMTASHMKSKAKGS